MKLLILIFALIFTSCVTVNFGAKPGEKSDHIEYIPPAKPYVDHKFPGADKAWMSESTGNVISYISVCSKTSDPSLDSLAQETVSSMDQAEITQKKRITYNGREALQLQATGEIDGIPLGLHALVFKKNGCQYRLIFSGLKSKVAEESKYFQDFSKEFKTQ